MIEQIAPIVMPKPVEWGLLSACAVFLGKYLLQGGALSIQFYKNRRNGNANAAASRLRKVVREQQQNIICPLERAGTIEKVNTIERNMERLDNKMLPAEIFLNMMQGISGLNATLQKLIGIIENRPHGPQGGVT